MKHNYARVSDAQFNEIFERNHGGSREARIYKGDRDATIDETFHALTRTRNYGVSKRARGAE